MRIIVDKNCPKCYVVTYSCGQYEDSVSGPVGVFETKELAEKFCEEKENWRKNIDKLAIRDSYNEYDYDNDCDSEDCSDYSNLYQECENYWWKKMFGDKSEDELTDEEWESYNEKIDEEDCFKNYMIEVKGYSPEVAEATIVYNDSDAWSEYNTCYYIEEVPYIKN